MKPMFKAIIVDDEPAARRLLNHLCVEYGNFKILAEAANGTSAIELINKLNPDVVFLDIQMPDLTGIEVLEKISFKPNVIFTTAYEHFAIKAYDSFAVDYLLKPIKEERFAAAIQKLERFGKLNSQINLAELQKMIAELKPKTNAKALPIKIGEKILLIDFDDIAYLEANDKYVNVFTLEGTKYLVDFTLSFLEEKLPETFLRVQKSYIINKTIIKEVHKHFNGRFVLILKDKPHTRITTGLTYYEVLKRHFSL
jgi:two-component system LytT family response regulator